MEPYYADEWVTLYHGDCLEVTEWLAADVLVTDPPYGINWSKPKLPKNRALGRSEQVAHQGIKNDGSLDVRNAALALWGMKPAVVFGSPLSASPQTVKQVLVWQKPSQLGFMGVVGGWRRDWEAVYLCGRWPASTAHRSSVIHAGDSQEYLREGHPHSKPVPLMSSLIAPSPDGVIADPFAGSGSTLVAAKGLGRKAIGVELEERFCEIAARRLAQDALDFSEAI